MKNIFSVLSIIIIAIIFTSCRPSAVVVKERPVAPVYVRTTPPRPNYVWVEPGYVRVGSGYAYRQGYWIAPRANKVYRQGYWKNTRRGYVWVPGRW